jgi:diguanylate cyclase (GGDEF)-like protein
LPQGIKDVWEKIDPSKKTSLILAGQEYPKSAVFVFKSGRSSSSKNLSLAMLLLNHAELTLLNLEQLDELKQQTFVDDLTGLYNSRFLKYAVTNAIVKCKDPGDSFSVLFVDVDHFKSINDKYGHVVGSEFLVAIGRTIKNAIRGIDPAFRYGGDEFVVILNKIGTKGAKEIAERIRTHIERRVFFIKGQQLRTTVSIGIANYPEHAQEREALLKLADEAMYSAKKSTRNAVHLALGLESQNPVKKAMNH